MGNIPSNEEKMADKGGAIDKEGRKMQRRQGKSTRRGQNQQDQEGKQAGQENWPVDEIVDR
jgi:hypothetical protein